jgi:hypothetical protein
VAVCADDSVPVGDICRDGCYGQHGCCGGEADGVVDTARHGYVPVIVVQQMAVGAAHAAGRSADSPLRCDRTYRTISGRVKPGSGMGSSSVTGWEEFGRSHPARNALNLAQPS